MKLQPHNIIASMGDPQAVRFTLIFPRLPDGITEPGGKESLNLELRPTPSKLQVMPIGVVFFKNRINLTIIDADHIYVSVR